MRSNIVIFLITNIIMALQVDFQVFEKLSLYNECTGALVEKV